MKKITKNWILDKVFAGIWWLSRWGFVSFIIGVFVGYSLIIGSIVKN